MQDKDTKTHRHRKIRHRKISNTTIPHHARGKTHRTSTPQDTQDKTQRRTNSTLKSTAQANYYAAGFAVRWQSTFQYVRMCSCPENVGNRSFSPSRMNRRFLQDISRAVSRFSRGAVAGNHRQHFFDSTGSNTITIVHRIEKNVFCYSIEDSNRIWPSWIEKVLTVIYCNWAPREAPREAGNSSG